MDNNFGLYSLKDNDEVHKSDNILKLDDPPGFDSFTQRIESSSLNHKSDYSKENFDNDDEEDLLNLHEPPEADETENTVTDKIIGQFANDFVCPIVKEAIELHKMEIENVLVDKLNLDSSGDKESGKRLSTEEFEYLKHDDFNDVKQFSYSKLFNQKPIDDSFLIQDLSLRNDHDIQFFQNNRNDNYINDKNILCRDSNTLENRNFMEMLEDESIVPVAALPENTTFQDSENDEEEYNFDLQEIINASNNYPPSDSIQESENLLICDINLRKKVKDIIFWKNPLVTFTSFSLLTVLELGLILGHSILSILAYFGFFLLIISFIYNFAVKLDLLNRYEYSHRNFVINSDDLQTCVNSVLKWIELLFDEFRSLICVTSVTKNIKTFMFFVILAYIGQLVNLTSVIFIGTLTVFILPPVYISFQCQIDDKINETCAQIFRAKESMRHTFQQLTHSKFGTT